MGQRVLDEQDIIGRTTNIVKKIHNLRTDFVLLSLLRVQSDSRHTVCAFATFRGLYGLDSQAACGW